MLLGDEKKSEIHAQWLTRSIGIDSVIEIIEAAILAKLASAELPEPYGWAKQSEIEQNARFGGSVNLWRRKFDNDTMFFTAAQLHEAHAQGFAAGAAAQITRLGEKDGPNT